jgi:hypothetical protein
MGHLTNAVHQPTAKEQNFILFVKNISPQDPFLRDLRNDSFYRFVLYLYYSQILNVFILNFAYFWKNILDQEILFI